MNAHTDAGRQQPADAQHTITSTPPTNGPETTVNVERKSATTQLIEMATNRWMVLRDERKQTCAVPLHGPHIVQQLNSTSLQNELAAAYFDTFGRAVSKATMSEAMSVLAGRAQRTDPVNTSLRYHHQGDRLTIDLGDESGQCVVVDACGWRVEQNTTVLFRRTELTGALPVPQPGGRIDELLDVINVNSLDLPLLLAWMVSAMLDESCPVGFLGGSQGAGKSSAARTLVALIDPSPVPLRTAPTDIKGWPSQASGSQVVVLDNMSQIKPWFSDVLCTAVTGDGYVSRTLYTNGERHLEEFRRAILITSIDVGRIRGDLADRIVTFELDNIVPAARKTEAELNHLMAERRPPLFGAILDVVSWVLRSRNSIEIPAAPRMMQYAINVAAIDQLLGTTGLERYLDSLYAGAFDIVGDDPVAGAILLFVERQGGEWVGTAKDLLEGLEPWKPLDGSWPKSPQTLQGILKRLLPALASQGLEHVRGPRTNRGASMLLRLEPTTTG